MDTADCCNFGSMRSRHLLPLRLLRLCVLLLNLMHMGIMLVGSSSLSSSSSTGVDEIFDSDSLAPALLPTRIGMGIVGPLRWQQQADRFHTRYPMVTVDFVILPSSTSDAEQILIKELTNPESKVDLVPVSLRNYSEIS
jgi:hypothetical protein